MGRWFGLLEYHFTITITSYPITILSHRSPSSSSPSPSPPSLSHRGCPLERSMKRTALAQNSSSWPRAVSTMPLRARRSFTRWAPRLNPHTGGIVVTRHGPPLSLALISRPFLFFFYFSSPSFSLSLSLSLFFWLHLSRFCFSSLVESSLFLPSRGGVHISSVCLPSPLSSPCLLLGQSTH